MVADATGRPAQFEAVARRARARDLHPPRITRVLPHTRLLSAGANILQLPARRCSKVTGVSTTPRSPQGGCARAGTRHLAVVPAHLYRREGAGGAVHAQGQVRRRGTRSRRGERHGAGAAGDRVRPCGAAEVCSRRKPPSRPATPTSSRSPTTRSSTPRFAIVSVTDAAGGTRSWPVRRGTRRANPYTLEARPVIWDRAGTSSSGASSRPTATRTRRLHLPRSALTPDPHRSSRSPR